MYAKTNVIGAFRETIIILHSFCCRSRGDHLYSYAVYARQIDCFCTSIRLVGNSHVCRCCHGRVPCQWLYLSPADWAERPVLWAVLRIVLLFDFSSCCNAERELWVYCVCCYQMRMLRVGRRIGRVYRPAFQRAGKTKYACFTLIKRTRAKPWFFLLDYLNRIKQKKQQ